MVSPQRKPPTPTFPSHRRTISAPIPIPPQISVEDTTQPLTNPEEPLNHLPDPHHTNGKTSFRRADTWRKRSPGVGWKKRWDDNHDPWTNGRVLIVDCYSRDHSDDGRRKTQAYEFTHRRELQDFYSLGPGKREDHALRIIHVQNAVWAREFLLAKFNINSGGDDVVGTSFGRWAKYDKPQYRAGRPVLNAKSFRTSRDPWRGVSRTGFGVDYLKSYKPGVIADDDIPGTGQLGFRLMALNRWEEAGGVGLPIHGYDVYVQRLSVYIQRNEGPINLAPADTDVRNPYIETAKEWVDPDGPTDRKRSAAMVKDQNGSIAVRKESQHDIMNLLSSLDNGSTMIVFEASQTGNPSDTLIQARQEIEVRWRRMMFYLSREDLGSDDKLALECMDLVLKDIFKGLQFSWEKLLSKSEEHVDILEDKIYENPADESRAPELWTNSSLWLKLEKLISLHRSCVADLQLQMRELSDNPDDNTTKEEWFKNTPADLSRMSDMIDEELIKPTANLSDLMYKSVGIRDARYSIELGTSMWRLSWITFIFLPLTFIGGFFGMNVDLFQADSGYPSIKWYFIVSVPLMIVVVIVYLFIKSSVSSRRDNPIRRGTYEQIYEQFTVDHPQLWSRAGPKTYVIPKGLFSRLKWVMVKRWFDPAKTILRGSVGEVDEMSFWARLKKSVAQRWLGQIVLAEGTGEDGDQELGLLDPNNHFNTVNQLIQVSSSVAIAEGEPIIATRMSTLPFRRGNFSNRGRGRIRSPSLARGGSRASSPGSDMVVEEDKSDDEDGKRKDRIKEGNVGDTSPAKAGARRSFSDGHLNFHGDLLGVPLEVRRGDEHAP
ncbi:hypothetical protein EJ08DRAFT_643499 [Tothia fuscella]|uniref:Uncharacterized protein n=1 Tax=Tothia fuscella TaxID=1048955 RepID=A0A9P4TSK8_9PEZI|nr:hypothetical protein EJ08DRAFT_643499 [Tothia fuscella]